MYDVIVIGGGAAGMMAAYTAASRGLKVLLLEKNEKLGRKIYITGKGRCNFTNACDFSEFIDNIVSNPRFMYSSLKAFGSGDMVGLLESTGCRTKVERGMRAFPSSDHASDVTRALERRLKEAGAVVKLRTWVDRITAIGSVNEDRAGDKPGAVQDVRPEDFRDARADGSGFAVDVLFERWKKERYTAGNVIIATGGLSYPSTGSTGDGYEFARAFGHSVTGLVPALLPLKLKEAEECRVLAGVSLRNVGLSVYETEGNRLADKVAGRGTVPAPGSGEVRPAVKSPSSCKPADTGKGAFSGSFRKRVYEGGIGELLFTHTGISGPLVLSASSYISRGLAEGARYTASIDLKPALGSDKLDERLLRDLNDSKNMDLHNALSRLLISALRPVVLRRAGIAPDLKVRDLRRRDRLRLVSAIKSLEFTVTGTGGFDEAVITQGGIDVNEVNPRTMESRKVKGLYFAGEVLDVDALTGGFNLQIAWSTGHAAGMGVKKGGAD